MMKIKELKLNTDKNQKLSASYELFKNLLSELRARNLPQETVNFINTEVDQINATHTSEKDLRNRIKKSLSQIIQRVEKEHKLVTKNHYRNTWLVIGMAVFGIPIGVTFGASLGNIALLSLGLPIGMVVGIAVGTAKDKKAFEEGRQLDLEVKH
ncbi:MAG: hypothetical protein WBG71_15790 [Leeuwenhoekiella sp.]